MSMNAAPARPGCGCGGNSDVGTSGCGCGSGAASAALAATTLARPRFFAGQLLTEDDLTALTDYLTAKNELHNRYLFGAGVVCGLWVSCDPCGGSTVTVQPGYALDCCGRDLVLRCAATLDVNAMVRDLLAAQLGQDCGDPCADQGTGISGRQSTPVARHYRLYARYGEQKTDPVAPYATGDQCGSVTCEPTRIREGISFVLKCPAKAPPPDDLPSRLRACQPGGDMLRRQARLRAYAGPMAAAARLAERPAVFTPADAGDLLSLRDGLATAGSARDESEVQSAIEHVRQVTSLVARYDLAQDRPPLGDLPGPRAKLGAAATGLAAGATPPGAGAGDPLALAALLDQAKQLADQDPGLARVQLAMLAQGQPLNQPVLEAFVSDAAALQEWILDRLDNDPGLADCQLRSQARAVSVTTTAGEVETAKVRSLGRAGSELADLFDRLVQACRCQAVNPPCPPCEDTDVPLACVEVADCAVVRICNAERDYVLSGPALRYWYPGTLPQESTACACDCGNAGSDAPPEEGQPGLLGLLREVVEPADAQLAEPRDAAQAAPPAASENTDRVTAEQILELERRVEQLAGQLEQTQAKLSALGEGAPAKESKPAPRRVRASGKPAAKAPAETREPAGAQEPATDTEVSADADGSADSGEQQ